MFSRKSKIGKYVWLWILRIKFWSNIYEKKPTLGQLSPKCQMSAGNSKHLLSCSPHFFTKFKNRKICMALDSEGQFLEQSLRENANFRPIFSKVVHKMSAGISKIMWCVHHIFSRKNENQFSLSKPLSLGAIHTGKSQLSFKSVKMWAGTYFKTLELLITCFHEKTKTYFRIFTNQSCKIQARPRSWGLGGLASLGGPAQ